MTPDVVTAQSWLTLDAVRHLMLRHGFSAIPAYVDSRWHLLTDQWIAKQLAGLAGGARNSVLARAVGDAVKRDPRPLEAELRKGDLALGDQHVIEDLERTGVVLVADPQDATRLVGILSPPDIL